MTTFNDKIQALNYMFDKLDPTEVYSVGIHKNFRNSFHEGQTGEQFSKSVLTNGLTMHRNEAGLTSTVHMLGSTDFHFKCFESLDELFTATDNEVIQGGVLIAIPGSLRDLDGNEYYLGLYPDNLDYISKYSKEVSFIPFERYTDLIKKVPPEFVLCTVSKIEGKTTIVYNDRFISNLSLEEEAAILADIKEKRTFIKTVEESKDFMPFSAFGEEYNTNAKKFADLAVEYVRRRQELREFYGVGGGPRL